MSQHGGNLINVIIKHYFIFILAYRVLVLKYLGKSLHWYLSLGILVTVSSFSSLRSWTDMEVPVFSGSFNLMLFSLLMCSQMPLLPSVYLQGNGTYQQCTYNIRTNVNKIFLSIIKPICP